MVQLGEVDSVALTLPLAHLRWGGPLLIRARRTNRTARSQGANSGESNECPRLKGVGRDMGLL